MTILDNIKPVETISNAQSRDTGNFGLKTQNKDKRENKINPQKPQRKRFKKVEIRVITNYRTPNKKKRDPTKTPWETAIVFLL